jgi:beta-N-acetylhexosaminidase
MIANATVPGLSDQPAAVSSDVIESTLRRQLGFRGLIITDSLSAGAIGEAGYTLAGAAVAAVVAGADMVLFGSTLAPTQSSASAVRAVTKITGIGQRGRDRGARGAAPQRGGARRPGCEARHALLIGWEANGARCR